MWRQAVRDHAREALAPFEGLFRSFLPLQTQAIIVRLCATQVLTHLMRATPSEVGKHAADVLNDFVSRFSLHLLASPRTFWQTLQAAC